MLFSTYHHDTQRVTMHYNGYTLHHNRCTMDYVTMGVLTVVRFQLHGESDQVDVVAKKLRHSFGH